MTNREPDCQGSEMPPPGLLQVRWRLSRNPSIVIGRVADALLNSANPLLNLSDCAGGKRRQCLHTLFNSHRLRGAAVFGWREPFRKIRVTALDAHVIFDYLHGHFAAV